MSVAEQAWFELPRDKTNKVTVCSAMTQISLGIRPVWSESSLSAWRKLGSLATHRAHSEETDQTGRMSRLIWVFAGRTLTLLVLSWGGSFSIPPKDDVARLMQSQDPWLLIHDGFPISNTIKTWYSMACMRAMSIHVFLCKPVYIIKYSLGWKQLLAIEKLHWNTLKTQHFQKTK